ncbi:DNA polymerase III subunit gamma/tau [Neisseria sp. KEM232]|uniref:DNA polymerase III subunit gamma/tau n=1 Tax=unclassified Neisseria TaxID=2623750 RepID=UPI000564A953|nr:MULTISPECIES: DNA polymerase III subunit gamma/tau [unclassified Neisseria]ASP17033.1 DNA polymerase III subunit gamma/tau [Neisseria sp. KEM232]
MAYQVLARKWRPKTFADLVGQEHVVKALQNALDKGRLHHAYLLTGTRGVGKTTIARILAKSLNCEKPQHGEPCGECQSCRDIDAGRYVDLLEIDAASNTGIDNIREVLENAQYAPTAGKYKVYIIDEVHMLSKSAFNAMLKTLEEPPEHVKFILATTDPHKVPVTVLSRCLQFVLRNMTAQQVAAHLEHVLTAEQIPFEPAALQLLGRAAAGSMRDALSLLDQAIAMGSGQVTENDVRQMIGAVDKRYLYELLDSIAAQNGAALLQKAQEMAERAVGFDNALSELALLLQRLALMQTVPAAVPADDPERPALAALAAQLGGEQIQLYYQCAIRGKQDLSLAPDEYAGFVMTLLRMLAFAPMAAPAHVGGHIAGSGLSDPAPASADNGAVETKHRPSETAAPVSDGHKTPADTQAGQQRPSESPANSLPASTTTTAAAERPSENHTAEQNDADGTPPWEDAAVETIPVSDGLTAAPQTEVRPSETPAADRVTESESAKPVTERPSENPQDETAAPSAPVSDGRTEQNGSLPATPAAWQRDEDIPFDELPTAEPAQEQENAEEEGTEEADFAPLPELSAANWHAVIKRLNKRLGAAQMLADHMAWTNYDTAQNRLLFALNGNAPATTTKEYFDKIRNALAEAYGLNGLSLQTVPWQEDKGWETPAMRRARLQREGREEARRRLEADPDCRALMVALNAEGWHENSLLRAEDLEEYGVQAV